MAIPFANAEYVSRSSGSNACCKGAYNARTKIKDEQTNITYNFQKQGGNVFHEILLPEGVDKKFLDTRILMNEVERTENRKNSQLLKEYLLALPDEKNVSLELKKEMIYEFIKDSKFIEEGLAVQIDIHEPDKDDKNWHAHLLVTTRRFTQDGKQLGKKARDLEPLVRGGRVNTHVLAELITPPTEIWVEVQNRVFVRHGLENRVDPISSIPQEHIGPIRMRSSLNEAVIRNEERRIANIELLKNGRDVLNIITKQMSVFSKKDLFRAVKCVPDQIRAEALVEDALRFDQGVVVLYHKDGSKTGFYTTAEIREEELKLMRLGNYIKEQNNLIATGMVSNLIKDDESLSNQQQEALSHLLLGRGGIKVLKGRAGTGKSHVLGKVAAIAASCKIEVMGLAPTHKAKLELAKVGYERCDTIKGFLFKLYNDRVDLAKNSLILVDEAGMVGNDDYSELLRVAAARGCNVILAGDERQLSSIQRGGMFSAYANRFGYFELNEIRRQEVQWGKEVALAFSVGSVREGINVLISNDRLVRRDTKIDSMESLLTDWNNSIETLEYRLIIAVKNSDVDIINKGARELLKDKGVLSGLEYLISKKSVSFEGEFDDEDAAGFMRGDRIVFKETNKSLNINNRDFGKLTYASYKEFRVKLDRGEEVVFNPNEFSGFKHGYASTVYKAQSASIRDVYVLHNGFATMKNSYVALSRHVKDLHLYTNYEATKNDEQLIHQLSFDPESRASINYFTKEDLAAFEQQQDKQNQQNKGLLARIGERIGEKISSFARGQITSFVDKHQVNADYYVFEKPEVSQVKVEEILELVDEYKIAADSQGDIINEQVELEDTKLEEQEKAVVGGYTRASSNRQTKQNTKNAIKVDDRFGNAPKSKQRKSAKARFYANREYQQNKENRNKIRCEIDYEQEIEQLRKEAKWGAEKIAKSFFGEPNKHLSNKTTLRYGEHGKLAIRISGEKAGNWYDFSQSKGGDLFDLVQDRQGCDFKGVVAYLRDTLGISGPTHLRLVHDNEAGDKYVDYYKQVNQDKALELAKIRKAENLYNRSINIEKNTVPYRYLSEARNITCNLGPDVKTCLIFDRFLNKKLPAIVAFARDASGNITGGQQVLLDPKLGQKAAISVPKKSFGKIAGSFVEVASRETASLKNKQDENLKDRCKITIIAEGLETALSIKQAGIEAKILCSLGISNIKNYIPQIGERIIIAADNDGENSITEKTIIEAKNSLAKHAMVNVVKPDEIGDFNDYLQKQGNIAGTKEIRGIFEPVINSLESYSDKEAKIIVSYEQFKGEKTDIDQFLRQNRHLLDNLVKIAADYDIAKLKDKLENLSDLTKLELLKHTYNEEFSLSIAKIEEQIDLELANVKISKFKLSSKKINIDDLRAQVTNYAIDRWQAQNYLPLADNQVKAVVSRSLFELNNKERIIMALNGWWFIENPDEIKPLSYKVKCERVGEKITKISGYLVEKTVLDSPDMHLQIKKDDDIIREAIKIGKTRRAKLDEALAHDPQIHELSSLGSKVQRSVAEQLVDYKLQHVMGMDANVTTERLELMKTAAELEQKLLPDITDRFKQGLHEGFVEGKISDDQQKEDIQISIDLAVHRLRTEVHEQMHDLHAHMLDHHSIVSSMDISGRNLGHDKDHYMTVIQKTVTQVKEFQEDVNLRRDQHEEEHEQMHQNGISIGMNM